MTETRTKTIKLGLIGDNIARSKSPRLHRTAGQLTRLEVTYDRLIPKDLELSFEDCFAKGLLGSFKVTRHEIHPSEVVKA